LAIGKPRKLAVAAIELLRRQLVGECLPFNLCRPIALELLALSHAFLLTGKALPFLALDVARLLAFKSVSQLNVARLLALDVASLLTLDIASLLALKATGLLMSLLALDTLLHLRGRIAATATAVAVTAPKWHWRSETAATTTVAMVATTTVAVTAAK